MRMRKINLLPLPARVYILLIGVPRSGLALAGTVRAAGRRIAPDSRRGVYQEPHQAPDGFFLVAPCGLQASPAGRVRPRPQAALQPRQSRPAANQLRLFRLFQAPAFVGRRRHSADGREGGRYHLATAPGEGLRQRGAHPCARGREGDGVDAGAHFVHD